MKLLIAIVLLTGTLHASGLQEGFPAFGPNDWCVTYTQTGEEKPWPRITVLAKWAGNKQDLLAQLTSPEWVAKTLGVKQQTIQGKRTTDGMSYRVAFPVVGKIEIPVKQTVEETAGGFRITFQCEDLWLAKFGGAIEVESLPPSKFKVDQRVQPEQFLLRLTLDTQPTFPLAAALAKDYSNSVSFHLHNILMEHAKEFTRKSYHGDNVAMK
jgi:hypothetical protein